MGGHVAALHDRGERAEAEKSQQVCAHMERDIGKCVCVCDIQTTASKSTDAWPRLLWAPTAPMQLQNLRTPLPPHTIRTQSPSHLLAPAHRQTDRHTHTHLVVTVDGLVHPHQLHHLDAVIAYGEWGGSGQCACVMQSVHGHSSIRATVHQGGEGTLMHSVHKPQRSSLYINHNAPPHHRQRPVLFM